MNKIRMVCVMSLVFLLGSCLDDTGYLDIYNHENDTAVASFGQADHGYTVRTVEVLDALQPLSVGLNIARATSDVTFTIAVDPAALDEYNEANDSDYELLPDSAYTLGSTTVTVPKGTLDGEFVFNVASTKISLAHSYILPLTITAVSEGVIVASNLKTALVSVGVKNQFDGIYSYAGTTMRYGTPGVDPYDATGVDQTLSGSFTACTERPLATITKFSNGFDPLWKNCTGIAGIGTPTVTVDPNTIENWGGTDKWKVTVTSTANATLKNMPGQENTYDPATKTFVLNFFWGGAAPVNTPGVRTASATLKYTGPR